MGRPKKVVVLAEEKVVQKPRGPSKSVTNREKITRAKAIRLMCIECMGFQVGLVNVCTDPACPLWCYRRGKGFENTEIQMRK
jgi:hypothetical protein